MFRHLVEQGKLLHPDGEFRRNIKLGNDDVPASVRLVIGRRLARLSDSTLTSLGTAAVIGRSFTFELLAASTQVDPNSLLDCVEEAERAGLISSTVQYPEARFRFSHELIRQAVISRVSVARRQRLHLSVAAAIEGLHANTLEDVANELAHHLLQAGTSADGSKTARFLEMAAKRLLEQGAYDDGIRHLYNALELIERFTPGAERDRQELLVQLVLGRSLANAKGWAAAQLEPVYARARELCAQIRDPALAFRTLYGQWLMRYWRQELNTALEVADELLAAAEEMKDPAMLLCGNHACGVTLLYLGELASANEHLEKALAAFDLRQALSAGLEASRLGSFFALHFALYGLGYPDRAWAKSRQMLELAQRSSVPFVLANASCYAALHNLMRGDGTAAQKSAEEAMALTEQMGLVSLSASATIWHGASLIAQGHCEEGIAGMRRGFSAMRATGGTPQAYFLCLLASGLGRIRRLQEGLEVVEEGLASVAKTGEQFGSPYLHHVKGELLLVQNSWDGAEGERCFRTAIEIARRQSARAPELRATTSLARLLAKQSRRDEARTMLAEIYGWFTEGFDTPDLKDAKTLLDKLND